MTAELRVAPGLLFQSENRGKECTFKAKGRGMERNIHSEARESNAGKSVLVKDTTLSPLSTGFVRRRPLG